MPTRRATSRALAALLLLACPVVVEAADPKVPPGRDPGGIAIAIIGDGLDYRRPELAQRLARDGEGELIGWDFADNDARPHSSVAGSDRPAELLLAEGQAARLVVARVGAGRHDQIAMALRFAADTPARVVVIVADPGAPLARTHLAEAARHLARLLIVVPASSLVSEADTTPLAPEQTGLIVVTATADVASSDVLVPPAVPPSTALEAASASGASADRIAAARVAALAARLITTEPGLSGAALRARIMALARAAPSGARVIHDIGRMHWRE